jgi:hypothetical protein
LFVRFFNVLNRNRRAPHKNSEYLCGEGCTGDPEAFLLIRCRKRIYGRILKSFVILDTPESAGKIHIRNKALDMHGSMELVHVIRRPAFGVAGGAGNAELAGASDTGNSPIL